MTQFRTELGKRWLPDQRGVAADQRRFVLAGILRGVVTSRFDHDLRDHAEELSGLVQLNAQLAPVVKRDMRDPRFLLARSGLYWQVELRDRTTLRSPSLLDALFLPTGPNTEDSQPAFVEGPTGPMRLIRRLVHPHHLEEPIDIRVGVDERLIDEEMTQLNLPLAAALGIVAIGLFGAAYAQIAYSLQPLARIRQAAAAVCSGRAKELPDSLPREVMPLVKGLNGMIVANQNMVERARVLAGNLAHALKMPLDAGASSNPADIIQSVIHACARLRGDGRKTFTFDAPSDLIAACDPNDLTEMIGNLVDNAAKWSREHVLVTLLDLGDTAQVTVEDDGPGVAVEQREAVFGVGIRLDEQKPGTGLGLVITHDLVTLYGGRLWIERSRYDGAAVKFTLSKIAPPLLSRSDYSTGGRQTPALGSFFDPPMPVASSLPCSQPLFGLMRNFSPVERLLKVAMLESCSVSCSDTTCV